MPSWRRTLTLPPRKRLHFGARTGLLAAASRPIVIAAALFIPAKGALAQSVHSDAFMPQSLQPHSVRTLLRDAPQAERPSAKRAQAPHAVAAAPQNVDAILRRAAASLARGDREQAIADYIQAVRFNPKHAYSLYSLGLAKRAAGDEAQAQVYIARAKDLEHGIGP